MGLVFSVGMKHDGLIGRELLLLLGLFEAGARAS
jgi:hypothetical protein